MTDTQPEALRRADELETEFAQGRTEQLMRELAAECRISAEQKLRADQLAQQHRMQREINHADGETILALRAENEQLRAAHQHTNGNVALLTDILNRRPAMNAGLVEAYAAWTAEVYSLMGVMAAAPANDADRAMRTAQPASAAAAAQEPVAVPRFNCWSTNEGDSWFDHPADSQAIYDCLGNNAKVGDEYELTAGWESVTARYRITEVVGDGEEYEVECISHPQENTAPPPSPTAQGGALDAERLDWLTFNLSGKALRDIGVVWSEHGDARRAIDAARTAQEGK